MKRLIKLVLWLIVLTPIVLVGALAWSIEGAPVVATRVSMTPDQVERAKKLARELPDDAIWSAVGRSRGDGGPHPLDLERLRYDDQRVLGLFRRADTAGIFQFESGGMRKLLAQMKPDRLEDLIAAAINDAVRKVESASKERMSGLTAGLQLPPGMKLPF